MFTKESLYINALKYDTQLKLDSKKLNNEEIISMDNSVFLVDNDVLSSEVVQKINTLQNSVETTFISTLLISDTTKLVPKALSSKLTDCEIARFNHEFDIAVLKNTLFETKNYFVKTGIDYVYSAFHVMNTHIEKTVCKNELLIFLFNEKAFILVLNHTGIIVYDEIVDLPTFESVKKTHFYDDDLDAQRLFDEMYYLELNEIIQKTLNDFYAKKSNVFVEKITMLYILKQMTDEDIELLSKELMMEINYHPINLDEEIFELSRDKHLQRSFVEPRKKKKKRDFKALYATIFAIIFAVAVYNFFVFMSSEEEYEEPKVEAVSTATKQATSEYIIPDHVYINDKIEQRIKSLFSIIPNDVILKEFKIDSVNLEMRAILLNDPSITKSFKETLDILYKSTQSQVLTPEKKTETEVSIISKTAIDLFNVTYKKFEKEYITDELMNIERVTEQLKILMPENTIIKFVSSSEGGLTVFKFAINILVKEPKEFFNLIHSLNSELYSININYPIHMVKTAAGIEVEFNLDFNQLK